MTPEKDLASEWHTGFGHVAVLLTHLRMAWLLKHAPPRLVWAVYVGINGFVTIGLPAGATTLIVALGIISQPKELVVVEVAVVLLTGQAFVINRLAGISYPLWGSYTAAKRIIAIENARQ